MLNKSCGRRRTFATVPDPYLGDFVDGCERAVAKMVPHESAGMAPGVGADMTEGRHVPLDR